MDEKQRREIESLIGYEFAQESILQTAFTHASYAWENGVESNRRLEFLGDAVLNFLSARMAFYGDAVADEGRLTKLRQSLVSKEPLARAIRRMNLMRFLLVGKNENPAVYNDKSVSDLYEAIVGAIYRDANELMPCELFFHRTVCSVTMESSDPISVLKEWSEKNPNYEVVTAVESTAGEFLFTIRLHGQSFLGRARAKKDAEREACRKACVFLGEL